jgi:hypothetical protein
MGGRRRGPTIFGVNEPAHRLWVRDADEKLVDQTRVNKLKLRGLEDRTAMGKAMGDGRCSAQWSRYESRRVTEPNMQ